MELDLDDEQIAYSDAARERALTAVNKYKTDRSSNYRRRTSKLEPHRKIIADWYRRGDSLELIATYLLNETNIKTVSRSTILRYLNSIGISRG